MGNWQADLKFGEAGEFWLSQIGKDSTVEVKTDRRWADTGNVFFELSCAGKPSGIMKTDATYFAYIFSTDNGNIAVYLWQSSKLRLVLAELKEQKVHKIVRGGDGNRVEGMVVPLDKLGELIRRMNSASQRIRNDRTGLSS